MTNQEILFRMFICAYMGWELFEDEDVYILFDLHDAPASRIIDLFPREIEPESFEGYVSPLILKLATQSKDGSEKFNIKVKITILDS
jgi:hypothetical protein